MNLNDYNYILRKIKPEDISNVSNNDGAFYVYKGDLNIYFKYTHHEEREYGETWPENEQEWIEEWCPVLNRNWKFTLEFYYSNTLIKSIECINFDKCPKGILPFISFDYTPIGNHMGLKPKFVIYKKDCELVSYIVKEKYTNEMIEQIQQRCLEQNIAFELRDEFSKSFK